jgi:hypothetical protein
MMSSHGNKLKELENKLKTLADADFNNIENLKNLSLKNIFVHVRHMAKK